MEPVPSTAFPLKNIEKKMSENQVPLGPNLSVAQVDHDVKAVSKITLGRRACLPAVS